MNPQGSTTVIDVTHTYSVTVTNVYPTTVRSILKPSCLCAWPNLLTLNPGGHPLHRHRGARHHRRSYDWRRPDRFSTHHLRGNAEWQ